MKITHCWHFKKHGITRIKTRICCIKDVFPTRTSGREYSPYGSAPKHQPSFKKIFFYSSQLRVSSLQSGLVFPLLAQGSLLQCWDLRKGFMTFLSFLLLQKTYMDHWGITSASGLGLSTAFSSKENCLPTTGFSFFIFPMCWTFLSNSFHHRVSIHTDLLLNIQNHSKTLEHFYPFYKTNFEISFSFSWEACITLLQMEAL